MNYPNVTPHDLPKQIADDLFVVYGSIQLNALIRFTRNMAIVRDKGVLTLINPVRMNDDGLAALDALGEVTHVLRLGFMHGMDDQFYVDRYNATFWSFAGGVTYTTPVINETLTEGCELPFSNAALFSFNHLKEPEGVILLERGQGILLTCDSLHSYTTPPHTPHTNWLTRRLFPLLGLPRETVIGPIWMKNWVTDKAGIRDDFERLLSYDFDQLLSAHGVFLTSNAREEVKHALAKMFK